MLGPPDTVVELGNTEVTEEIFMDYLSSLGETTYRFVCLFPVKATFFHCRSYRDAVEISFSISLCLFPQWGQVQIV